MSKIVKILIAASSNNKMEPVADVQAIAGRGLEGDRYSSGAGTFSPENHQPETELTLIEQEKIEAFAAEFRLPFTAEDARRNLVTTGVDLNALVGREFQIGEVRAKGLELCEPCNYLAKQTFPEALKGLVRKGGLRAAILTSGQLQVGDELKELA